MFQTKNYRKSVASKARKSFYLSRSQIEDQTNLETIKSNELDFDKEEFFKKIIELLKSESRTVPQNNQITEYLLSLTNLGSVFPKIQSDELSQHIFLYNITKSLKFEFFEKNEMLMKYGEAGFNFYFLLKGSADIIVSKWQTVYLTEKSYLEYLMRLKIYGENDFLQKTLYKNKKNSHLNIKALNDFVFEEVKKIKTPQDYENLSEEYQSFYRDFILKANYDIADWSHFKFNNTFNTKNSFNFEKENNENENYYCKENLDENSSQMKKRESYFNNKIINNKNFILNKGLINFETQKSNSGFVLEERNNKENPEKTDFYCNPQHNSNLIKNKLGNNPQESIIPKASNLSIFLSPTNKSNLNSKKISCCERSGEKNKLLNLIRIDSERKKSIIHFKGILESHTKASAAAAASPERNKRKESYFYNPSKKITTEEYINRIKPTEAFLINNKLNCNYTMRESCKVSRKISNVNGINNNYFNNPSEDVTKEFKILLYYHVKTIKSGDVFGQMALLKNGGKRTATLIATEDCYLGVLDKKAYIITLQEHDSKRLNQDINLFIKGPIFSNYPKIHFFKNVFNLFEFRKVNKGSLIAREGVVSEYVVFVKEGVYEVRVKSSLANLNGIIKLLGGKAKIVHNEEDYLLDYDDFREYMNKKLEMKILLINQANVIGFRDFVIGNKFLFTIECISNSGSAFFIKREVFDDAAYHCEYFINKNIKEYEKIKIENVIERLGILKNSYIDIFLRRKNLPRKQNLDDINSFLQETKYNISDENNINQVDNKALFTHDYFNNRNKKIFGELSELSKRGKKYSFFSNHQISDCSSYGKAFLSKNESNIPASITFRKENQNIFYSNKINMLNKFEFSPIIKRNLNIVFSSKVNRIENSSNKLNADIDKKRYNNQSHLLPNLKATEINEDCASSCIKSGSHPKILFDENFEEENKEIKKRKNLKPNNIKTKLKFENVLIIPEVQSKDEIFSRLNNVLGANDTDRGKENSLPVICLKPEMKSIDNKKDFSANLKSESGLDKLHRLLITKSNRKIGSKVKFGFNEINKDDLDFSNANASKRNNQYKIINKISAFSESLEKKGAYMPSKFKSNNELKTTREAALAYKKHLKTSSKALSKSLMQKNILRTSNVKLKNEIQMLEVDMKIINLTKLKKRKVNSLAFDY